MMITLVLLAATTSAFPAAEERRNVAPYGIMDVLTHSLDRLVNKLVDDTHRRFPELRQALADFREAVKSMRLHQLTHAAVMKTLTGFTRGLYQAREQMATVEHLHGVVTWLDEKVKGICFVLSLYHEDCGYPDIDTVGAW